MWKSVRGRNKNSVLKDEGSQRGPQIEMHREGDSRRESILNVCQTVFRLQAHAKQVSLLVLILRIGITIFMALETFCSA